VAKDGFAPQLVALDGASRAPTRVTLTAAQPYRVRVVDQASIALPRSIVDILWDGGKASGFLSYLSDARGYAEVYAPLGAMIGAHELTGSGESAEQPLGPTQRDLTLRVETSDLDEASGMIEPPEDSQRSGPYVVEIRGARGGSERKILTERAFSFRGHFGRTVEIDVTDRATGATGRYDDEPKVGIVVDLHVRAEFIVDLVAGDTKDHQINDVRIAEEGESMWHPVPFSRLDRGWLVSVPKSGRWRMKVTSGDLRGFADRIEVDFRSSQRQRYLVHLAGPDFLEVEVPSGIRLHDGRAYLQRRTSDEAASANATFVDEEFDATSGDDGRITIYDIPPGTYDVVILGLSDESDEWICASPDVHVEEARVARCVAWSAPRRRIALVTKTGEAPDDLSGSRIVPLDGVPWLRSFLKVHDDEDGVFARLWPGRFQIVGADGAPRYDLTVADGSDRCVLALASGK
jgi:hypothetical protein